MKLHQYSEEDGDGKLIWIDYDPQKYIPQSDTRIINTPVPSLAPVDESVEERAIRRYGNDPHLYGGQRDGFVDGYNECLKEHVRIDDVVKLIDASKGCDGKIHWPNQLIKQLRLFSK